MAEKTPITILHDLSAARKLTTTYELIEDETGIVNPSFKYQLTIVVKDDSIIVTGVGLTKKEAKHNSAKQGLERLIELNLWCDEGAKGDATEVAPRNVLNSSIKTLCDICGERQLPMPHFEVLHDEGPPHAKQFTTVCRISSLSERGVACTKKAAKQLAAFNMIELLQSLNCDRDKDVKILTSNFDEYDCPFKNYDEDKVAEALNVLQSDANDKEKMEKAFRALDIEYEICEEPKTMYKFSTKEVEPGIYVSECTIEDLYKRVNRFLKTFLE